MSNENEMIHKKNSITDKIQLTEAEIIVFRNVFKHGIYKELYARNFLTDIQLNELLKK